jgi:hypothetical protein
MATTAATLVQLRPTAHVPVPGGPPGRPCPNCEAPLVGPYCAGCGQRDAPDDPTLREVAADAFQELVSVDGRLLATLRALLRPGRLTIELAAGRRARYVSPLRVYLTCSVLLFAVLTLQPDRARHDSPGRFSFFGGVYSFTFRPDSALVADYDRGALRGVRGAVQARMLAAVRGGDAGRARLEQAVTNALPQAVFLLVPVYALLTAVAYRGARHGYPRHLYFALHVHAFAFLALAALFAFRAVASRVANAADVPAVSVALSATVIGAALPTLAWIPVYAALAYRRVYDHGWAGTAVRVVAIHALYWALTVGAMFALLVLAALRA